MLVGALVNAAWALIMGGATSAADTAKAIVVVVIASRWGPRRARVGVGGAALVVCAVAVTGLGEGVGQMPRMAPMVVMEVWRGGGGRWRQGLWRLNGSYHPPIITPISGDLPAQYEASLCQGEISGVVGRVEAGPLAEWV